MGYKPHLIGNFGTGLQTDRQPWLIPDDAQHVIYDGFIHHGVIQKRDGYNFLARGLQGGYPYCESRVVKKNVFTPSSGAINSANTTYTFNTAAISSPVRRGGVRAIGSSPSQLIEDNGTGGTKSGSDGTLDTTITDYLSFPASIQVTFTTAPATGSTVTLEVDTYPKNPVMMIANFINDQNVTELIVADTANVNKLNVSTNRLDDITESAYTGTSSDFFTWTQYPTPGDLPRLIFSNNVNQIQYYDGTNVGDWYPVITSTTISAEAYDTGDGTTGPYTHTASNLPITPFSVTVTAPVQTVTDDGMGNLTGDGNGTIDYTTGEMSVTFNAVVAAAAAITVDYEHATDYVVTASKVLNYKDRLILLRTTEFGGQVHPQRIRISGLGQSGDDFRTSAIGAGVIDIPSPYWIRGAVFNRDDVMIFTDRETWILKYTGNDVVPFTLDKIDGSRGNKAPFAPISYLNLTKAYSPIGFIISDGYQVQRYDEKIPDYAFEMIDQDNFDLCFSGSVEDDQSHYLIHPSPGQTQSDRILVNNYDENNFSVYRIPLSCMGIFFERYDITWDYLTEANGFPDWQTFGQEYATWNDISYSKNQPIAVGGGHKGEIWRIGNQEGEDNPLRIYAVSSVSSGPLVVDFTTDCHNYVEGDYVFFSGLNGSTELNNKTGQITSVADDNTIRVKFPSGNPASFTAYTSGGTVSRVIPFEFVTKNFNPYSNAGLKTRCGWIYLYLDVAQTDATDVSGNRLDSKIKVEIYTNDNYPGAPTQVQSISFPYQFNSCNFDGRTSLKVWRKVFINQNARFVQFRFYNAQPATRVRIHAMELGFMPGGRII